MATHAISTRQTRSGRNSSNGAAVLDRPKRGASPVRGGPALAEVLRLVQASKKAASPSARKPRVQGE